MILLPACGNDLGTDVSLPMPDHGFQLSVGPFPVIPSSEVQDCYYLQVPIHAPMDVHRMIVALNPGTHHMNLFRFVGAQSPHQNGDIQRGCWDAVAFENYDLIYNSQTGGESDWTLPAGVSQHFDPGDMFMLQTHYVNAVTQKTELGRGKVVVNFYEAGPGDAQYRLGSLFANNRGIVLPPHQPSSFTTECPAGGGLPQDVNMVALSGHFHSRGIEFDIGYVTVAGGADYHQMYQSLDWGAAPFGTYNPGMPIPRGGAVRYTCKFQNDTDSPITFGAHVEYQEHCNVFGYFYPALPDRTAIYCF